MCPCAPGDVAFKASARDKARRFKASAAREPVWKLVPGPVQGAKLDEPEADLS